MQADHRSQIVELTDTLKEALLFLNSPAGSTASYLKGDCLVCLGQILGELEQEPHEDYKAIIADCGENITKEHYGAAYTSADKLQTWIQEHVQIHYEVVFLPYKAEMWDAFDSVWRAAKSDPQCIVHTVPIPYHCLDPQGRELKEEYEGDRLPAYVEVTHYQDIDLGKLRPDVIFIHNPYDDRNRVTRVHKEYFSSNLIKYTNKLVYIPYFITLGKLPSGFAKASCLKYTWKTFVESESIRQDYLEEESLKPEQIVAMGSPKLDYLYTKMQEDSGMPPEWEAALKGRTVFLFNSSLGRLLSEESNMVRIMKKLFDFFKQRNDLAIIWRPHPLFVETLKSMKPKLLNSYQQLVKEFRKLPNAVYDESEEMHTAIIHSDAYIGDYSSVIIPYALTGKPVLKLLPNIQSNLDFWAVDRVWLEFNEERNIPVSSGPGIVADGEFLFPAVNRGGVFTLNLATGKTTLAASFPNDNYIQPKLFTGAYAYEDLIWFVPDRASEVAACQRSTGEIKTYGMPPGYSCHGQKHFSNAVQHGEYLWMLPADSNMIVRLHMVTGDMKGYEVNTGDQAVDDQHPLCTGGGICNGQLWTALRGQSSLLQIDLITGTMQTLELDFLKGTIGLVAADGQALWLATDSASEIIRWNPLTKETTVYAQWPKGFVGGNQPFSGAVFDGESVWLVPHDANMIIKVCLQTGIMTSAAGPIARSVWAMLNSWYPFDSVERNKTMKANSALFSGAVLDQDWIWFCPVTAPAMFGIHRKTGEVRQLPIEISRVQDEKTFIMNRFPEAPKDSVDLRSTFIDRTLPLECFVDMVCNKESWNDKQRREVCASLVNADGTSGEKIWKYIAEQLKP